MPTATGPLLRSAMRRVASPVTVVTAVDALSEGEGKLRGMTVGSFTSVSLQPPLVSFNVQREAYMHDLLRREDARFAVNILREDQAPLAAHFAVPDQTGAEQFGPVAHRTGAQGIPALADALEVIYGRVEQHVEAGDHAVFIGRVTAVERGGEGAPLLYYESEYHGVGYEVDAAGRSSEALASESLASESLAAGTPAPASEAPPADVNCSSSETP